MLRILQPGLQSTLQGAPRKGYRHFGVPHAGPADPLSMALANWLVGNPITATAIEITYGGFSLEALAPCSIAIVGAAETAKVDGCIMRTGETLRLGRGGHVEIPHCSAGMRTYLSIVSGFAACTFLASTSTYLPAGFGGLDGRTLQAGDELPAETPGSLCPRKTLPAELSQRFTNSFALRACPSAEFEQLSPASRTQFFEVAFTTGRQSTRMGMALEGAKLDLNSDGLMPSAAVYPGTIQCPEGGTPIVLLCDGGTTGGYPRIAQIARCDRHLLGQIRPGDQVRLLHRTHKAAAEDCREKTSYFRRFVPEFAL